MAITSAIAAIGTQVAANQQRQKAKGEAGKVTADAQAAQDAADAKLKQQHDANLNQQSAAGAAARNTIAQPLARSSTLISPNQGPQGGANTRAATAGQLPAPVQRKTLLGS